jgi:hypothetical protein
MDMENPMKLLGTKYKTVEGARKRAAFENGLAKGEFERGDKAKHYRYSTIQDDNGLWRVARDAHPVVAQ